MNEKGKKEGQGEREYKGKKCIVQRYRVLRDRKERSGLDRRRV